MNAAITFIIPAYNAAGTLPDTLRSVLSQTRRDWSTIVIDDGSRDGTSEVVTRFLADSRFQLLRQANSGVAASRNRALSMVQTAAVCFLDADDTIEPFFVERMLPALEGQEVAAAAYRLVGPKLQEAGWAISPTPEDVQRLTEFNSFAIGAVVFDRAALARVAGESPFAVGSNIEDWEVLAALRNAQWATPITGPMYSYRLRPDSRTTALWGVWRDGLNLIAVLHPDPRTKPQALRRWTVRNLARAAAADDHRLVALLFEHLDRLTAFDADTLAGALRWSMRRMSVAGEPQALQPAAAWSAQVLNCLSHDEVAVEALRRATHPDWNQVAAAAAARIRPDQTLVIYGLGRNGRELLRALEPQRLSLAVIDDGPASVDLPRLTVPELRSNHIVLVTPDDRSKILTGLARGRQAQVLLPEQLVA
jgi:hypothetical protein